MRQSIYFRLSIFGRQEGHSEQRTGAIPKADIIIPTDLRLIFEEAVQIRGTVQHRVAEIHQRGIVKIKFQAQHSVQ